MCGYSNRVMVSATLCGACNAKRSPFLMFEVNLWSHERDDGLDFYEQRDSNEKGSCSFIFCGLHLRSVS